MIILGMLFSHVLLPINSNFLLNKIILKQINLTDVGYAAAVRLQQKGVLCSFGLHTVGGNIQDIKMILFKLFNLYALINFDI